MKRGELYFEQGYVGRIRKIDSGTYEATVRGSDDYAVEIELENDQVIDYFCDCPYDFGPVCKHIVAVLFALRESKEENDEEDEDDENDEYYTEKEFPLQSSKHRESTPL
ncbi:MAG: SWIM zinc finger family protein [Bacteroides sp.]|nr:SWIM zinc finger family protein [Bacteroides sp.]